MTRNNDSNRSDGWSNWFRCLDEDDEEVTDIVNSAVRITLIDNANQIEFVSSFTLQKWREMGSTISHCKKLQELSLKYIPGGMNEEVVASLFQAEGPYDFPLKMLSLQENRLGPRGIAALLPFLKSRGEVYNLDLSNSTLGDEGALLIAEALDTGRVRILSLSSNGVTVKGLSRILASQHARHLERVGLQGNCLGRAEIDAIAQFLRRDDTSLEFLCFGDTDMDVQNRFDADWVDILVESLRSNTSMKEFHLDADLFEQRVDRNETNQSIFDRVSSAITSLVCDVSSLDALIKSNHVLQDMSWPPVYYYTLNPLPIVKHALDINAREHLPTIQKIRLKLASMYFRDEIDLHPLTSMNATCIPRVLELASTSERCSFVIDEDTNLGEYTIEEEYNLNGVYQIVRNWNVHDLFSYPSRHQSRIRKLEADVAALRQDSERRIEELERWFEDAVRRLEAENCVLMKENKRLLSVMYDDRLEGVYPSNKRTNRDSKFDDVF
mmetsp:Transcript_19236/g.40199  ORF Transcript_19236/g.40199 Transcript_19236/m.40199 type:complete len:496 (-) Transcript_19236:234-1721(-)